MSSLDAIDRRILAELQRDAARPLAEIARAVGLAATPCWRRIQLLEKVGIVTRRVALLDPQAVGVGVTVFVRVKTGSHSYEWLEDFTRKIAEVPEVVACYRMSGDIDYLLKVVVPDIAGYDRVYKRLVQLARFAEVSSSFALETLKETTALPLDYLDYAPAARSASRGRRR